MDVKLFSSNFKIATFLILAHFSFLMSFGQNKPKSNLVKIGNCTYSVDGNISAFNEATIFASFCKSKLSIYRSSMIIYGIKPKSVLGKCL